MAQFNNMNCLLGKYVEIAAMMRAAVRDRTHYVGRTDEATYDALNDQQKELMFETLKLSSSDPDDVEIAKAVLQMLRNRMEKLKEAFSSVDKLLEVGVLIPRRGGIAALEGRMDRVEAAVAILQSQVRQLEGEVDMLEGSVNLLESEPASDLLIASSNSNNQESQTTAQSATPQSRAKRGAAVLGTPVLMQASTSTSSSSSSARQESKKQKRQRREEEDVEKSSAFPPKKTRN